METLLKWIFTLAAVALCGWGFNIMVNNARAEEVNRVEQLSEIDRCTLRGRIAWMVAQSIAEGVPRDRSTIAWGTHPNLSELEFLDREIDAVYAWADEHPLPTDATAEQRRAFIEAAAKAVVEPCWQEYGKATGFKRTKNEHMGTPRIKPQACDPEQDICCSVAYELGDYMIQKMLRGMTREEMVADDTFSEKATAWFKAVFRAAAHLMYDGWDAAHAAGEAWNADQWRKQTYKACKAIPEA